MPSKRLRKVTIREAFGETVWEGDAKAISVTQDCPRLFSILLGIGDELIITFRGKIAVRTNEKLDVIISEVKTKGVLSTGFVPREIG